MMTAVFELVGLFDDCLNLALTRGQGWISPLTEGGQLWYGIFRVIVLKYFAQGEACLGPVKCLYCLAHSFSTLVTGKEGGWEETGKLIRLPSVRAITAEKKG